MLRVLACQILQTSRNRQYGSRFRLTPSKSTLAVSCSGGSCVTATMHTASSPDISTARCQRLLLCRPELVGTAVMHMPPIYWATIGESTDTGSPGCVHCECMHVQAVSRTDRQSSDPAGRRASSWTSKVAVRHDKIEWTGGGWAFNPAWAQWPRTRRHRSPTTFLSHMFPCLYSSAI